MSEVALYAVSYERGSPVRVGRSARLGSTHIYFLPPLHSTLSFLVTPSHRAVSWRGDCRRTCPPPSFVLPPHFVTPSHLSYVPLIHNTHNTFRSFRFFELSAYAETGTGSVDPKGSHASFRVTFTRRNPRLPLH